MFSCNSNKFFSFQNQKKNQKKQQKTFFDCQKKNLMNEVKKTKFALWMIVLKWKKFIHYSFFYKFIHYFTIFHSSFFSSTTQFTHLIITSISLFDDLIFNCITNRFWKHNSRKKEFCYIFIKITKSNYFENVVKDFKNHVQCIVLNDWIIKSQNKFE